MKAPELIPVDLRKCFSGKRSPDTGSCHDHPDISSRKQYLAKIGGQFFAGKFSRVWFGWSFDGWVGGQFLQLDKPGTNASHWQGLWEIRFR